MQLLQSMSIFMLVASMVTAVSVESTLEPQSTNSYPVITCCGSNGLPGRDGHDGNEGPRGDNGEKGLHGLQGAPGKAGPLGAVGPSGLQGEQGTAGEKGQKGESGRSELDLLMQRVSVLGLQMKTLEEAFASHKKATISRYGRSVGEKVFFNTCREMNFEDAERACAKRGSFLASPRNLAENTAVQEIVSEAGKIAFLGVNDIKTEGTFAYPTGEEIIYSNWSPNEPNGGQWENCAEMYSDGKWNDKSCQTSRLIICEF